MTESATWRRMRSGDWKLVVPGREWAVGFVWKTFERGYGYSTIGWLDKYCPSMAQAKRRVEEQMDRGKAFNS